MTIKGQHWEAEYARDEKSSAPMAITVRPVDGEAIEAGDLRAMMDAIEGAPWDGVNLVNRLRELSFGKLGEKLPGLGAVCEVLLEQVANAETELAKEREQRQRAFAKAAAMGTSYGAGLHPGPGPAGAAASAAAIVKGHAVRVTKLDEKGNPLRGSDHLDAMVFANLAFKDATRSRELKELAREWLAKPNVL